MRERVQQRGDRRGQTACVSDSIWGSKKKRGRKRERENEAGLSREAHVFSSHAQSQWFTLSFLHRVITFNQSVSAKLNVLRVCLVSSPTGTRIKHQID